MPGAPGDCVPPSDEPPAAPCNGNEAPPAVRPEPSEARDDLVLVSFTAVVDEFGVLGLELAGEDDLPIPRAPLWEDVPSFDFLRSLDSFALLSCSCYVC